MKNVKKILRWLPPRRIHSVYITVAISDFSTGLATPLITFLFFSTTSTLLPFELSNAKRAMYYAMFIAIYKISGMASNPVFGSISDVFGRKKVFRLTALGTLLFSICTVTALLIHSLWIFTIGACVFAFSWALKAVAAAAISDVSLESRKIKNLALLQFCTGIGVSIGPFLSGYLGSVSFFGYDYMLAFIILGAFSVFLLLYIEFSISETLQKKYQSTISEYFKPSNFKVLFSNKSIYFLMIIHVFNQLSWGAYYDFIPAVSKTVFNYGPRGVGLIVGLIGLWLILATGVILPFIRKFLSNTGLINFSCIIGVIGVFIAFISSFFPDSSIGHIGLWVSTFPVAAGDVILFCVLLGLFSSSVNQKYQGTMIGLVYIIGIGMWVVGAPIGGLLMNWRMNGALLICPIAMVILVVFLKLSQNKKWFLDLNKK